MKNGNLSVGFFVVGGLLLFGAGMFLIGDRRQAFGQHAEYYSEFEDLAGLANGSKVRVGGMDAGEVVAIDVPDSPTSRFRLRWRIPARMRALVRTDSLVTIDTEGVVGGTYLSVRPGSPHAAQAAALATIPSREPAELSELLTRGTGLLTDAQALMKDVGGKLSGTLDTVNSTVSNVNDIAVGLKQVRGTAGMLLSDDKLAHQVRQTVTTTSSNVDEILADLKAGRGPAGMLLRNEEVAAQIRDALNNVQGATANLGHATHQADALISDLNSQQLPRRVSGIMDNVGDTAKQVNQVVSEMGAPDRQGTTAGANIRESLANVNVATQNLADDSEALKHNFLLRGFFKRRGYYNLDHMPPEKYRQDTVFASRTNYRAWLSASQLFQDGLDGQTELSAAGKALLDGALSDDGDLIFQSPIVIEGYDSGAGVSDQLRLSRVRAILVRQYLQARFQIDAGNIGIVALRNAPPNGIERTTWDGICVVVLRRKSS
jgi:phospholipid/cholesterol/gamma-HCH transport system substrate-binding protein